MSNAPTATLTNYSTLIFLINPKVRAIKAVYEPLKDKYNADVAMQLSNEGKAIKAEIFKTFDPMISVDDYILVPTDTRHKMTVCKVVETDVTVELDHQGQIDWVIGTIDSEAYDQVRRSEEDAIRTVKNAKANKARKQLEDELRASVFETGVNMETLQIAHMGARPAAPQTPPPAPGDEIKY